MLKIILKGNCFLNGTDGDPSYKAKLKIYDHENVHQVVFDCLSHCRQL